MSSRNALKRDDGRVGYEGCFGRIGSRVRVRWLGGVVKRVGRYFEGYIEAPRVPVVDSDIPKAFRSDNYPDEVHSREWSQHYTLPFDVSKYGGPCAE